MTRAECADEFRGARQQRDDALGARTRRVRGVVPAHRAWFPFPAEVRSVGPRARVQTSVERCLVTPGPTSVARAIPKRARGNLSGITPGLPTPRPGPTP